MRLALAVIVAALVAPAAARADWPLPPPRTGVLYLSGYASDNVAVVRADGTLIRTITHAAIRSPRGVAEDAAGNIVVVSQSSSRVLVFDVSGRLLRQVTHADLTSGTGLTRGPDGNWYVGNFSPGRVVVFDAGWRYVRTLTAAGMSGVNCVAFDPSGSFAVSAAIANRVYRFDGAGKLLGTVSHPRMGSPMSIALDSRGNHYLSNGTTGVVIKFDAAWRPLLVFGSGTLAAPQGIAVDEKDRLTISNWSKDVVHTYDTAGKLLGSFALSGARVARNIAFQTKLFDMEARRLTATAAGDTVTFAGEVCASGQASPAFGLALFHDRATAPGCGAAGALLAGEVSVAPGRCEAFTVAVPGFPAGRYRAHLRADGRCALWETREDNNTASATVDVLPGRADLSVKGLTATVAGGQLTHRGEICNAGPATREVAVRFWYHRAAATAPACGEAGADLEARLPLGAGACLPFTLGPVATAGAPAGSYASWMQVDADCQVTEASEANNAARAGFTLP